MRKNKLTHLLEPSLRLYFVFLLLFAAVSALFSVAVAVIEAAVVAVLYLYFRRSNAQRQKEIIKYIESVTCNMDTATKDTMVNAPLPMVIFRPENDEVIWSNDRFLQLTGQKEHLYDTKLSALLPGFDAVINTVPAPVLPRALLQQLPGGALIIDLASLPGGTDFAAAEELGLHTEHALALPGRCAPQTAGALIAQTVLAILEERDPDERSTAP